MRGPYADLIKHDLEDLYLRERARGMPMWRARLRHVRRLLNSMFSVWRADQQWLGPDGGWERRMRGGSMFQDFKFALRLVRKNPAPVSIAIGGLALAIGVVAAVFTVVDVTMLRKYGMDDPASVVSVGSTSLHGWSYWPYSRYLRMRDEATLVRLEASELSKLEFSTAPGADEGVKREALFVSGGYFQMLGGRPEIGRMLEPADDSPGAPLVAVVSHSLWSRTFNRDPSIVGKDVWLNGKAVTLVGVVRPEFTGPVSTRPSIWISLATMDDLTGESPLDARSTAEVDVIGRLAPGAQMYAAQENLSAIVNRLRAEAGATSSHAQSPVILFSAASPISGRDAGESYIAIASIFGIVGLVLAVACANTANLLLAAATTRKQEIGVRLSLGASTGRLIRQMVNESVLLALIAGGLGFLLSIWLAPTLGSILNLGPEVSATPDIRVLLFTIAVAVVCGLGAGLSPARHGARGNVLSALKSQSGVSAGGPRTRLRTSFVGFQAAVSVFLLVAAALLARSAILWSRTDAGFDADRLLSVSLGGSRAGFNEAAYVESALAALRELPSVESASVVQNLPWGWSLRRASVDAGLTSYQVNVNRSDESFFQTAGVRIVRGRPFTREEVAGEAQVALISESIARSFFRDADPIGQSLARIPSEEFRRDPATIIGVVAEAVLTPFDAEVYGSIHRPMKRLTAGDPKKSSSPPGLLVRTSTPARTARAVQDALRRLTPRLPIEAMVVRERMNSYFGNKQMLAWLAVPMALLAVLLGALGVFGVTAFVVSQRMREVSLRIAIGASAADVQRLLIIDSVRPVLIGLCAGLFVALIGAQFTARMFDLSGISPHDPVAIASAVGVLITGALAAVIVPARRASKADPATLLRSV